MLLKYRSCFLISSYYTVLCPSHILNDSKSIIRAIVKSLTLPSPQPDSAGNGSHQTFYKLLFICKVIFSFSGKKSIVEEIYFNKKREKGIAILKEFLIA